MLKSDEKTENDCQANFGSVVNIKIEAEMSKANQASNYIKVGVSAFIDRIIEDEMKKENQTTNSIKDGDTDFGTSELKSDMSQTLNKTVNNHFSELPNVGTVQLLKADSLCPYTNQLPNKSMEQPHTVILDHTKEYSKVPFKDSSASRSTVNTEMVSEIDRSCADVFDLHLSSSLIDKCDDINTRFSDTVNVLNDKFDTGYEKCTVADTKHVSAGNADTFVTTIDSSDESSSQDSEQASVYAPKLQDVLPRDIQIPQQYLSAFMPLYKKCKLQKAEAISISNNDLEACNKPTSLNAITPMPKDALASETIIIEDCSEQLYDTALINTDEKESINQEKMYDESSMYRSTSEIEEETFQTLKNNRRNIPLTIQDHTLVPFNIPTSRKNRMSQIYTRINRDIAILLKDHIHEKRKRMRHDRLYQNVLENLQRYSSHANADETSSCNIEPTFIKPSSVNYETQFSSEYHHLSKDILKGVADSSDVFNSPSRFITDHTLSCLAESSETKLTPQSSKLTDKCNSKNNQEAIKKQEGKVSDKCGMKLDKTPKKILKPKIDLAALNRLKTTMKYIVESKNRIEEIGKKQETLSSMKLNGNSYLHPTVLETECTDKTQLQSELSQLPKPNKYLNDREEPNTDCAAAQNDPLSTEMQEVIKNGKMSPHIQGKKSNSDQQTKQNTVCIDLNTSQTPSSGSESSGNSTCVSSQHDNIHVTCDAQNVYIINVNNICKHDFNCSHNINDGINIQNNVTVDFSEEENQTNGKHVNEQNILCKTKHNVIFCENKRAESGLSDTQVPAFIYVSDSDSDIEEITSERPIDGHSSDSLVLKRRILENDHGKLSESQNQALGKAKGSIKDNSFETQIKLKVLQECKNRRTSPVVKRDKSILKELLARPEKLIRTEKVLPNNLTFGSGSTRNSIENSLNWIEPSESSKETNTNNNYSLQSSFNNDLKIKTSNETLYDATVRNKQKTVDLQKNVSESNNGNFTENKLSVINNASSHVPIELSTNKLQEPVTSMHDDFIDIEENESDDVIDLVNEFEGEENKVAKNIFQKELRFTEISDRESEGENVLANESSNNSDSEHDDSEYYEELDEFSVFDDDFYDNDKEEIRRKRGRTCSATNSCYVVLSRMKIAFSENGTVEKVEANDCNIDCRKKFVKSYVNCTL